MYGHNIFPGFHGINLYFCDSYWYFTITFNVSLDSKKPIIITSWLRKGLVLLLRKPSSKLT